MENNQYHFRIRIGEIEVEATGPESYVKEMREYAELLVSKSLVRLKTFGAVAPTRETSSIPSPDSTKSTHPSSIVIDKEESVVEFIERLPNKTHQDKILAFAFYLEKGRTLQSFGIKEINDCYDEAKEAKSNTAQYFNLLLKGGLIMKSKSQPEGAPTQYILTRKGENTIKSLLSGN